MRGLNTLLMAAQVSCSVVNKLGMSKKQEFQLQYGGAIHTEKPLTAQNKNLKKMF